MKRQNFCDASRQIFNLIWDCDLKSPSLRHFVVVSVKELRRQEIAIFLNVGIAPALCFRCEVISWSNCNFQKKSPTNCCGQPRVSNMLWKPRFAQEVCVLALALASALFTGVLLSSHIGCKSSSICSCTPHILASQLQVWCNLYSAKFDHSFPSSLTPLF